MSFIDAFLNVLAILGIIVAGGFLVFFLGDLLLSVLEPRHKNTYKEEDKEDFSEEFNKSKSYDNVKEETFNMEEPTPVSEVSDEKFSMDDEEVKAVDYDEALNEQKSLGIVEEKPAEVEAVAEKKDDINELFNEDEDFDFGDNFDFDSIFEEEENKTKENTTEAIATQDIVPILPASTESHNAEFEQQLRDEIESLKKELAEQKELYEELKQQTKNKEEKWEIEKADLQKLYKDAEVQIEEKEKPLPLLTLEEYENRLEILRARLKVNEKELKTNKKEFLPLRKVRKNLDKDKEKLRRREALVAKQKVMLYGVNNIQDIDQEKAQKLAEDLDLLDGLKISVRHCEEVMEANKDRYPILETANRILLTANKEIKDDIAECETNIAKLKAENGDEGAELIMNASNTINSASTEEVLVTADGESETPKRRRGRPKKVVEETDVVETHIATQEKEVVVEEPQTETPKDDGIIFDFDNDEPSFEELFAIEQEENNNKGDKE